MKNLVISAILLVASSGAAADLVADMRCREIAFSRAAEDRDLSSFLSFLDADARFVGNSVLRGPDEIAAAWHVFFTDDGPRIAWRPRFIEVLESGDIALTRGPYRVRARGADGEVIEEWGTFNSIWRKDLNGNWRIIFDAGSKSESEPSETTRAFLEQPDGCE